MANFSLGKHPHVELCDLLKLEGWSESGAQAKIAIADGLVKVDGAVETRKRCKMSPAKRSALKVRALPSPSKTFRRRNWRLNVIPIQDIKHDGQRRVY